MNETIKKLFDEDQRACQQQAPADGSEKYRTFREGFRLRNAQVKAIIETNASLDGQDYFHACIMFIHGDGPEDFWQAYHYGLKSIDLNFPKARKFAASAYDRWLMYQGKPQKFGLQMVPDGQRLRLWDVDPTTSDKEREKWDVPPLEELEKIARETSKNFDFSNFSLESKPQWLKDAIKRWEKG